MVDAESPGSSSDDEAIPSKPVPKRTSSSSSKGGYASKQSWILPGYPLVSFDVAMLIVAWKNTLL